MRPYKKILVITYWGLGDFVWATSAISLIKQTLPQSIISVLMLRSFASFAKNNPAIDEIIFYYHSRTDSFFVDRLKKMLWFLRNFVRMFFARYDACVFLDNSVLLTLFARLLRIPFIAGPAIRASGYNVLEPSARFYTKSITLNPDSSKLHMVERYQTIARGFLGTQNLAMPVLPHTDFLKDKALQLLGGGSGLKICIAFCGGQKTNFLPPKKVISLAQAFNEKAGKPCKFFLLGDKNSLPVSYEIMALANEAKLDIKNLSAKTDLLTLKELFYHADLLVSVDTGIMHVAAATNINIVSLHGHMLPQNSGPVSKNAIALCKYLSCSPCTCDVCLNGLKCIIDIGDEEIVGAGFSLLKRA
jgi:heptosyltransferase-2